MKCIMVVILLLTTGLAYGQHSGEWYKKSPEENVYGLELVKAQEFLQGKKIKKEPVVALLTTGIDYEHEMIVNSLWINKKEKEDGIDNDKNGYADDIHGWNFLGSRDGGDMMSVTTREADREWFRLSGQYAGILFDGTNYLKYIDGVRTIIPAPQDLDEFRYFKYLSSSGLSPLGQKYGSYRFSYQMKHNIEEWDALLSARMPGKTREEMPIPECRQMIQEYLKSQPVDSLANTSLTFLTIMTGFYKKQIEANTYTWKNIYEYITAESIPYAEKSYNDYVAKSFIDNRKEIVGDDYLDFDDRNYGNNVLLTPLSQMGTATAGILVNICPNVKIMPLVVSTDKGEPYLKDIVNAIYYAVDNGADVIVTHAQNHLYPAAQRKKVADAIRYAEKKGVLVVVPTPEYIDDMTQRAYYPSVNMDERFQLNNLLVVANSDSLGAPAMFSNYGVNQLDIYAPGISIYTSTPGDLYRVASNAFFGATMTAGVAALIKAYNPNLSSTQIRDVILQNTTSREGAEVEKSIVVNKKPVQETFLFEQLCTSGGILNANKAVRAALNK